jgi:TonB family protein
MRIFQLVFILIILLTIDIFAQKSTDDFPITIVEQMPLFNNGGPSNFVLWVYQNLKYPETAIRDAASGKVFAKFKVDSLGVVKDIEIVRSARRDLDSEVLRVIGSSPTWTPGKQGGKNVGIYFTIPIEFDIQDQSFTKKIKFFSKNSIRSNNKKNIKKKTEKDNFHYDN